MKALKINDILKATDGKILCGCADREITDISTDSRKISEGCLFVPLVGEKFDGHDFISVAIENGAGVILTSKNEIPSCEIGQTTVIAVLDTTVAFGKIAGLYRSMFSIPDLAITGSVGKTTTKEMSACVLSQKYNILKNKGNFNNEIGVPLTVFGLLDEHEFLISEMGMSGFGEIDRISAMVRPDVVVMTNIGMSHIELLGSQENIFKAKSEFVKNMNPNGTVIINGDDEILLSHKDELGKNVITIGVKNKDCDLVAQNIEIEKYEVNYVAKGMGKEFNIKVPVPGEHNVYNSLCAVAVGLVSGVTEEQIAKGISEFIPDKMRMCVIEHEKYTVINDCYNAAPDSMKAALKVLSGKDGRKVAILGDIACLGEFSKDAHNSVGKEVFKNGIDVLITIGDESKEIARSAEECGMKSENIHSFDDVLSAISGVENILNEKDVILVKASRVMELERVTNFLVK